MSHSPEKESPVRANAGGVQNSLKIMTSEGDTSLPPVKVAGDSKPLAPRPRYFFGLRDEKGRVSELPDRDWAALVARLKAPIPLAMTQAALLALPDKDQKIAKATDYIVPCAFRESPSQRVTSEATEAHLLCLDIDDGNEALRMLEVGMLTLLGDLNAIVWHTARSTPEAPRLRVVVPVEAVPIPRYGETVTALARRLGIRSVTRESTVPVQPMYWPVQYEGSESPVIYCKTDGEAFAFIQDEGSLPERDERPGEKDKADLVDISILSLPEDGVTEAQVRKALGRIPASCSRLDWVKVGMALKHQFGEAGFTLWDDWSATAPDKYPDYKEIEYQWKSFKNCPPSRKPITIRSVFRMAGLEPPVDAKFIERCAREEQRGDASLLARLTEDQWLYDHTAKLWRIFYDGVWRLDLTRATRAAAKPIIAEPYRQQAIRLAQEINEDVEAGRLSAKDVHKDARERLRKLFQAKITRLNQRKYIDDVLHLAGDFSPCRSEEMDQQHSLLNLRNGTLDLKSGQFRAHDPGDRLTKKAAVEYRPDAKCPLWCAFVNQLFQGDVGKVEFLRRALGYSLSGETDHDFLVFCLGSGRNGKSTLLQIPQVLLGDYFSTLPIEAILSQSRGQRDSQASAELARLHGARMVLSSEIPEGRKLNESVVKDITAGDLITARMLYANPFAFKPTHKLWLMGNHRPEIRGRDDGIWRRIYLLTFEHSFPKSGETGFRTRDSVVQELLSEGPGILNWLIQGYRDISTKGLQPPKTVQAQTREYREDSDPLADFIADRCVLGPDNSCKSSEIWEAYCTYASCGPRAYHSQRALTEALAQRGHRPTRNSTSRLISGIAVQGVAGG